MAGKRSKRLSADQRAAISDGVKHYWNYMHHLQKKFSGNTSKEKGYRSRAQKMYHVKVSAFPKVKEIRKLYVRMRERRERVRKKIRKDLIELYGRDEIPLEEDQLDRFVNELYKDTDEGHFEDEFKT